MPFSFGSIILVSIAAGASAPQANEPHKQAHASCTGIVTSQPERMYDFKLGNWHINWRNKTGPESHMEFTAKSTVYAKMDGDILIDDQVAETFKGITFRTYDTAKKEWVIRWLPANSTFAPTISAKLENCMPVERHQQMTGSGKMATVRTSFTNITNNRFEFHQDWSMDGGETWISDVLYYEAIREEG